jgi:hypothetical protein
VTKDIDELLIVGEMAIGKIKEYGSSLPDTPFPVCMAKKARLRIFLMEEINIRVFGSILL